MRIFVRNQIVELIPTICEGIRYVKHASSNEASIVLGDCIDAINSISTSLEAGLTEERYKYYKALITPIYNGIEELKNTKDDSDICINNLMKISSDLEVEEEVKIEILFLPYKSSMWDSLYTIYLAAKEDNRCEPYVVPIPYFERNQDQSFGKMCYEGNQFPEDVPVIPFNKYDISKRRPDIIYIHNPYDDYNYVTSVHPAYYTNELKKYTDMLVYVPYFIPSITFNEFSEAVPYHLVPGGMNADRIVVNSEVTKDLFIASGYKKEQMLALGTPKVDAVLKYMENPYGINAEWVKKINGRKVILLNSSIANLLKFVSPYKHSYMELMELYIKRIIDTEELFLIWRPHPLLENTIKSMRPHLHAKYQELKNLVLSSDKAIFDDNANAFPAMYLSDALISDSSSIVRQYIFTGKPIFSITMNGRSAKQYKTCDVFSCYFRNDGVSLDKFCKMIMAGEDEKREERLANVRASVANSDGTSGEKIHEKIIQEFNKIKGA